MTVLQMKPAAVKRPHIFVEALQHNTDSETMLQLLIVVPFCLSLLEVLQVDTCISSRPKTTTTTVGTTTTTTTLPTSTTTALSMVNIGQPMWDKNRIVTYEVGQSKFTSWCPISTIYRMCSHSTPYKFLHGGQLRGSAVTAVQGWHLHQRGEFV